MGPFCQPIPKIMLEDYRSLLLPIARNMLRNEADAEDMVQETMLKWVTMEKTDIDNERGYLVRSLINRCLNFIRDRKREDIVPEIAPELLLDHAPAWLEQQSELSLGLLKMLEKLSPMERAVFLLKEVFGYSHREIAALLDISDDNSRQILSRAKRHLRDKETRFEADPNRQVVLYQRFLQVCRSGDMEGLLEILREDIELDTLSPAAAFVGVNGFNRWLRQWWQQGMRWELRWLRGRPGLVLWDSGGLPRVFRLQIRQGQISQLRELPLQPQAQQV